MWSLGLPQFLFPLCSEILIPILFKVLSILSSYEHIWNLLWFSIWCAPNCDNFTHVDTWYCNMIKCLWQMFVFSHTVGLQSPNVDNKRIFLKKCQSLRQLLVACPVITMRSCSLSRHNYEVTRIWTGRTALWLKSK